LEEVLLLEGLFNLWRIYKNVAHGRFEWLLACSDMTRVLRISTGDGGGEGYEVIG
jgi:hypothetical protein